MVFMLRWGGLTKVSRNSLGIYVSICECYSPCKITCKGHDAVISLLAVDDMRPAEA